MTDDLRVLVETAMAEASASHEITSDDSIVLSDGRSGWLCSCGHEFVMYENPPDEEREQRDWWLHIQSSALSAALSVRGPSGTPALIWRDDLKQVGWYGRYGIVPGGTDVDAAPHYRPVFVVRTEEQS